MVVGDEEEPAADGSSTLKYSHHQLRLRLRSIFLFSFFFAAKTRTKQRPSPDRRLLTELRKALQLRCRDALC